MSKPSSNLFMYIGKSVKDEYGRSIGRIASFGVNPNGQLNHVFIEHGDGEFSRYSSDQFRTEDGNTVILTPLMKLRVKSLCDEIPLIWRKDQALSDLADKKKIPSEMFDDLHKNFEGALNQLKAEAQATLEGIDKQIAKCGLQIRELNSALINLEIEREIGKIDDKAYQAGMEMILAGLKRTNSEKTDLEAIRNQVSNILLGEAPTITQTKDRKKEEPQVGPSAPIPGSPTLPEPPVFVHVKTRAET